MFSMMRNNRQILSIMQYYQAGIYLASNVLYKWGNDPKRTANFIKNYFQHKEEQKVLKIMVSSSSQFGSITWQKYFRNPTSTEDLCSVLQNIWINLPAKFFQKIKEVMLFCGQYWSDLDLSSIYFIFHFVHLQVKH